MIKLSKVGKINKKMFRLIISEKSRDPFGKILENLGSYNPYTKELAAKDDRIKYWLGKGAQMTATVNNLLIGNKVITGEKVVASKPGKKSEKRLDQIKAKQEKKAANTAKEETPAEVAEEKKVEEVAVEAETPVVENVESVNVDEVKEEVKE